MIMLDTISICPFGGFFADYFFIIGEEKSSVKLF